MLIRIENLGKDEVGILVDGRPKGTWKLPSLKYAEQSSGILLLIGGLLPQQRTEEYKNSVQLYKVTPFSGCLSELSVNGHSLGLKDLINKKGSVAVNLNSCQLKEEETEYKVEEREEYTTTSTTPRYIPVVTEVTEDPLPLLVEKDVGYREEQVKSEEKKYKQEDVEASPSYPGIMLDSVSPDLLPTVLEKTQTPEAIYNTIQMGNEASTVSPLKEKIEDYEDIEEMTTLMPAPSVVLLPSSGEMSNYKMSTDKTSIEKMSSIETSTYTMPHIETSTDKMPTTIIYSTEGQPVVKVEKQKEILEGLEQKIFPGLCDQKTCGIHGSCEEINSTHVTCHCRDFWAGQACEECK
uniref:Laminin EGF-like domain-containing protein n=1 Tax=Meloidogyne hapla TaxID=6305 RepID=A0A1I8BEP0_MELHA